MATSANIDSITDVAELNKRLDATTDLLERMELEDRLEKLGHKQHLALPISTPSGDGNSFLSPTTTTSASPKPPVPSPANFGRGAGTNLGTRSKIQSSHTFTAADKFRRPEITERPSGMASITRPGGRGKPSFTPDESSSGQHLMPPSPAGGNRPGMVVRSASQAKEQIMLWAQRCCNAHGIPVKNMTSAFADGVAFCAIVHYYFPDAFQFEDCLKMQRKERIAFAFQKAEDLGGVPQLIDPEDLILMGKKPDYKVMFTYMSEMYRNLKKREMIPE